MDNDTIQKIKPERPWAAPPPDEGATAETPALHRSARAPRRRARRLLGLRWFGFPKRSEAAWHIRQVGKHLRSLVGLRP